MVPIVVPLLARLSRVVEELDEVLGVFLGRHGCVDPAPENVIHTRPWEPWPRRVMITVAGFPSGVVTGSAALKQQGSRCSDRSSRPGHRHRCHRGAAGVIGGRWRGRAGARW
jgi:hypothetical protein